VGEAGVRGCFQQKSSDRGHDVTQVAVCDKIINDLGWPWTAIMRAFTIQYEKLDRCKLVQCKL